MSSVITGPGVAGYWLGTADGGVSSFGGADHHGDLPSLGVTADVVGMAALSDGAGYWLVGSDGGVFAFGAARFWGSVPGGGVTARVVGMASRPDGSGYWLLGEDGDVFSFGDVQYWGSLPGAGVVGRAVDLVPLADGSGYWILTDDGSAYTFGAAPYHGSFHERTAPAPIVGMKATPDEAGYWLLVRDGRVFPFGAAADHGSAPKAAGLSAIGLMNAGPEGYLMVSDDGAVLPFGVAAFHGSSVGRSGPPLVGSAVLRSTEILGARANVLLQRLQPHAENGHRIQAGSRQAMAHGGISFPRCAAPRVSIVIPVHGKSDLTIGCLHSIATIGSAIAYEVIVVDDQSPDNTASVLAGVANLKVVTNPVNVGFTKACNAGIAAATGEYVLLLNNDTEVTPGWLEAMVETADADPTIGVVGAKLLFADGTLQEAGGIIWSDGSGLNYGRGEKANSGAYHVVREVDYCSGACILVRADLLDRLGGLDERYSPAYYEDTDLAFAARSLGYKVVFQPEAQIVHHEGGSHGTDVMVGVKRYQNVNRLVFAEKWAKELEGQYAPDSANALLARNRRPGPRALVIDHLVPMYDRDSGSVRMFSILSILVDLGFVVTFVPANQQALQPYTQRLQQMGVEVLHDNPEIGPHIRRFGRRLTLCILSRPGVTTQFIGTVRAFAPWATLIYDTVDLHFLRERRYGEVNNDVGAIEASKATKEIELACVRAADATFTVSLDERAVLLQEVPDAVVEVVPNIHADQGVDHGRGGRHGLLFVGSFCHDPNRDSVHHLVRDIMPILRPLLPGVRLSIVGSGPTPDVLRLAADDVDVLGWVPDLEPLLAQTMVFVAPLRFGAGMKGKIGEALSYGIPTVTSSVGSEGMELVGEQHVLLADDPATFAAQVVRLHDDPELWERLSQKGRAHIASRYSPAATLKALRPMLERLGALPPQTS